MTNYPQQPEFNAPRGAQGMGENPLADPGVRMILSMSPLDGSIKPLPANLNFVEQPNGSMRVNFPDGSVRELIPGAEGEGRMVTTLADGTRIQSDLTMGNGQVSVASISSTGEKAFLSLNENGANMQKISPAGEVSNVIPDSAPELIESFREAEAFAQEQDFRRQDDFQSNQQYGEWNNYGKPADWQPEQSWQLPQDDFMPAQNFGPQFGGSEFGGPQPMPFASMQPQNFGGNDFGRPDYAGNNWVDNGNGSWIAPIQPDAFPQPQQNWQPPQGNYMQPQNFGPQFGGPEFGVPQPMPFAPMQPQNFGPQFGGDNFSRPDYAGNNWVDNGNGSWIAPIQPDAFQQPQQNWQPPQGNYMQPQNFGPQFGGPQGIIDTNGYPQAIPVIANDAWGTSVGHYNMKDFMQPGQMSDVNGFRQAVPTDGSGFPFAVEAQTPSFDGEPLEIEVVTGFDDISQSDPNEPNNNAFTNHQ